MDEVMDGKAPVLVSIKTEPEIENRPIWERAKTRTPRTPQAVKTVSKALAG